MVTFLSLLLLAVVVVAMASMVLVRRIMTARANRRAQVRAGQLIELEQIRAERRIIEITQEAVGQMLAIARQQPMADYASLRLARRDGESETGTGTR